jgi:hypothetical protein
MDRVQVHHFRRAEDLPHMAGASPCLCPNAPGLHARSCTHKHMTERCLLAGLWAREQCGSGALACGGGTSQVPPCNDGCMPDWVGDGHCDRSCNVKECNFDNGDCRNSRSPGSYAGSSFDQPGGTTGTGKARNRCSPGCVGTWVGDRYCDHQCKVRSGPRQLPPLPLLLTLFVSPHSPPGPQCSVGCGAVVLMQLFRRTRSAGSTRATAGGT